MKEALQSRLLQAAKNGPIYYFPGEFWKAILGKQDPLAKNLGSSWRMDGVYYWQNRREAVDERDASHLKTGKTGSIRYVCVCV